jgi:hypothetical protein
MSEVTLREDGLLVIDNLLPAATFRALAREVTYGNYHSVHAQKWDKSWRLWDGNPMRGESIFFDPDRRFGWKGAGYPTSTSVDELIDAVRRSSAACPDIVGAEAIDWFALYLAPWLYPVGSALSLHQDTAKYTGSFTFFVHGRWGVHWGGELIVSPPWSSAQPPTHGHKESWLADDDDLIDEKGIAICLRPRPNRLVLLGPDRPHRIARVDTNAGARTRESIAGFFLRAP